MNGSIDPKNAPKALKRGKGGEKRREGKEKGAREAFRGRFAQFLYHVFIIGINWFLAKMFLKKPIVIVDF